MYLYEKQYSNIHFLKDQSDSFIGWVCPLLKQCYIPVEQYIFYETDQINEIYFLSEGMAGFVLPFKQNVVYIEIEKGDTFGDIDLAAASGNELKQVEEMIENLGNEQYNMVR